MCDVGAVEYGAMLPRLWLPLIVRREEILDPKGF
jgi:hypothetical protein